MMQDILVVQSGVTWPEMFSDKVTPAKKPDDNKKTKDQN